MQKLDRGLRLTQKEIQGFRDSFREFPLRHIATVSDDGEGSILYATYHNPPCGCRVIGNGTIPFPLTIKFCEIHTGGKI